MSQAVVSTPETLMQEMHKCFGPCVTKKDLFAVGYMKSNMKVSIRICKACNQIMVVICVYYTI